VAVAFFGERIGLRRASALLTGFIGIVVLASGKVAGASITEAVIASTAASLLYGFGANMVRKYLAGVPTSAIAAATLSCAALLTLPFAIAYWPSHPVSFASWTSAILLGALCTGVAFALFYRLINRVGAARAVTVTYLVPLFGVLWAWWLLGEPLTPAMAVAGILIVGSVAISQRTS
jgi:drug/metabolite transporter (DMT)-like permease